MFAGLRRFQYNRASSCLSLERLAEHTAIFSLLWPALARPLLRLLHQLVTAPAPSAASTIARQRHQDPVASVPPAMPRPASKKPPPLRPARHRLPTVKSLRAYLRLLTRRVHPFPLLLLCLVLVLIPLTLSFRFKPTHPDAPLIIGATSVDSPILARPQPYGFAKSVMRSVLGRVQYYILGGLRVDQMVLDESVDVQHFHGWMIGHDPRTRVPSWTPTPFNFDKETLEMKAEAHKKTCYNRRRSNSLPLDRAIPDVRPPACANQWYYSSPGRVHTEHASRSSLNRFASVLGLPAEQSALPRLPTTSVIFVFYNEPLSPLLRAVYSVLNRTPRHLLHEIILVDDGSDDDAPWLADGQEFERHLQLLPKTRLARLVGRNGLMRARNVGASLATGETVTFLDSHIEVGPGWIEPLMGRIAEGMRDGINRVVVPAIDNIDADTFAYNRGGIDILGHTWGLGQTGIPNKAKKDSVEPMQSPIMAGGLLSLSRKYMDELGFYDPEMELWGGEEMEISFRIWLCGGTLECLPCSRVGHVFRSNKYWQGQVYKVPGEVIARNKRRASYWMDEYAQLARLSSAPLQEGKGIGSMKHYEDIKARLKCKPYRWYLKNVYPQMLDSANKLLGDGKGNVHKQFIASGFLRNKNTGTCLDHLHYKDDGAVYGVYPCHYLRGSQSVVFTDGQMLLAGDQLLDGCLTRGSDNRLSKRRCTDDFQKEQKWDMETVGGSSKVVRLIGGSRCLTVVREPEKDNKSPFTLRMLACGGKSTGLQHWEWESVRDDRKTRA